ncbi:hypothetical protein VCRA2110O318_40045 [Vibrio crassostreae]|nr:hypothetical protein VCRA2117O328_40045 [Vibrio crassostreae]CAK2335052.1 hypothetical protein VCRA2110O318_40045 [Vibrio crassostreae]CAK2503415.1 hypothetical protein VCRA2110O319_50045 [Vibrio crassostreae]CAK2911337.1 hypothetical protein VCRA217O317_30248 [Vibrio crassostreae]
MIKQYEVSQDSYPEIIERVRGAVAGFEQGDFPKDVSFNLNYLSKLQKVSSKVQEQSEKLQELQGESAVSEKLDDNSHYHFILDSHIDFFNQAAVYLGSKADDGYCDSYADPQAALAVILHLFADYDTAVELRDWAIEHVDTAAALVTLHGYSILPEEHQAKLEIFHNVPIATIEESLNVLREVNK